MFNLKSSALFAESWNVAWRKKSQGSILNDTNTPFIIINNSYRYWAADPFVMEKDGKIFIFAELYDYVLRRGILGCCELRENQKAKWVPIIKEPFHLSYPCIVCRGDQIYIMPESGSGKVLILYKAIDFPYKWEKVNTLRENVNYADTTPIVSNSMNLAITHKVDDPNKPELVVIDLDNNYPDKVVGKSVPFRSRPAGGSFEYNNVLVRPAQHSIDSGKGYGKGLVFYKYQVDYDMRYRESEFKTILPNELHFNKSAYIDGMHTYNATSNIEVIDIKTRRFNLINLFFRIIRKF